MTLALPVAELKQESPDIARASPQSKGSIETSASWLHLSREVVGKYALFLFFKMKCVSAVRYMFIFKPLEGDRVAASS
jgi:hypothetical protein